MKNTAGRKETAHTTSKGAAGGPRPGGGKGKRTFLFAAVFLGVAAIGAAGWFGYFFQDSPVERARKAGVIETADAVRIPLSALESGKAIFLEADLEGRRIHYFAVKSSDGVHRAAYDACDVCFRSNKGYRQEGDLMVCNNCGQTFPSVKVNELKGGCNPAPLVRTVDGDHLLIQKKDIAAGSGYFVGQRS
ncbi:MAG TPA: DUF2318 domain-containing protein [Deltaproteobacteria bacterium]|nr:DUF2318 domain-containing protein [Deltaproteobacteria bacterium]